MKRPATATIVVFVGILLVVAVIAGVVWTTTDGASAIQVGDAKMSREALNNELSALADYDPARFKTTSAAVGADLGSGTASFVVQSLLAEQALERAGGQVTETDRDTAREAITSADFRRLPQWLQDNLVNRQAAIDVLNQVAGDDTPEGMFRLLRREAQRTDVTVDPAYGRWAPAQVAVVPFPAPVANDQG